VKLTPDRIATALETIAKAKTDWKLWKQRNKHRNVWKKWINWSCDKIYQVEDRIQVHKTHGKKTAQRKIIVQNGQKNSQWHIGWPFPLRMCYFVTLSPPRAPTPSRVSLYYSNGSLHQVEHVFFSETIFKNGRILQY